MTFRPLTSVLAPLCLCALSLLTSACGNQWQARRADAAYQQALALNDPVAQRIALLALTKADEDDSDNWLRLAKLELDMGAYGNAYEHFSRAHEIDRTNVPPLSMMTELAVINGRQDLADNHLKELLVIAPDDRAVAVARGFGALRDGNYEQAQANATILLSQNSADPIANILQTRILVTQKKIPEAIQRMEQQLAAGSADDRAMLRSLGAIYRYLGQWQKAAPIDRRSWKLSPGDPAAAAQVVSDALQANDHALAFQVTTRVITAGKSRDELDNVLSAWTNFAPTDRSLLAALPAQAPDQTRIAFAHYLNQIGRADQAVMLLGGKVRSLGDRANVPFNAVFGEALAVRGQAQQARLILDRVLGQEADDPIALAARARLLSSLKDYRGAIIDAQRLVASYATIADYRVLLARIYRASDDNRSADRALWEGHRDLPLAVSLNEAVRQLLASDGDAEGVARLEHEHDDQKFAHLLKELA